MTGGRRLAVRLAFAAACIALPIEAALAGTKLVDLLLAVPTIALALAVAQRGGLGPAGPRPLLWRLAYPAGLLAIVAGFGYLALVRTTLSDAEVVQWGWLDKRPWVVLYLAAPALVCFHCFMVRVGAAGAPTRAAPGARAWPWRLAGALAIGLLAYGLVGLPALAKLGPADPHALARFFDVHSHVHLSAFEQIRLGALPYVEAQTQYGLGNQLLLYRLTGWVDYSNHGFLAANILLNVASVVLLFVVLQQALGFGWALAGLLGWIVLPSPDGMLDFAGWLILTRWLAVPMLALLLARLLLFADLSPRWRWMGPLLAGALWGVGGIVSQENLSGGLLVLLFALAAFGAAAGRSPAALARFAATFLAAGAATFALLVGWAIGFSYIPEVLALAGAKSGLVLAGISNSVWSDDLGLALGFKVVNGLLYLDGRAWGPLHLMLDTYGFAVLLALAVALLATWVARRWPDASAEDKRFAWKFGGVAVAAFVLHLFTLMRCDETHLRGPSLVLPLFLLALPVFAWRCLAPGRGRTVLLAVAGLVALDAALEGAGLVAGRVAGLAGIGRESATALARLGEIAGGDGGEDPARRYSPLPTLQATFRGQAEYEDMAELFALLHRRLGDRPVELGFYKLGTLVPSPELFYFLGRFRSVSGITSPMNSIWLRSEQRAWIDQLVTAPHACILFEPVPKGELYEAWQRSPGTKTLQPIAGRRLYGQLACKE